MAYDADNLHEPIVVYDALGGKHDAPVFGTVTNLVETATPGFCQAWITLPCGSSVSHYYVHTR